MNVATSTHAVDVICLNDKGESLAEGEPHQSHARITFAGAGRAAEHTRLWTNVQIQTLESLTTVNTEH